MQVQLTSRVTIGASPKEVFRYLRDPRRHYLWNPHLQSISTEQLLKKGTEYQTKSMFLGVTLVGENTISELIPNKMLEIRNDGAALDSCVNYVLEATPDGTVVKCITEVTLTSKAFAFTQPVLRMLVKREMQSDLKALKIAVEQKLL